MIIVLSQDTRELTTEEVVDWVRALGGECARLNADDITAAHPFRLEVDADGPRLHFTLDGTSFTDRDVGAVWLRRWSRSALPTVKPSGGMEGIAARINGHLAGEASAVSQALFSALGRAGWLSRPGDGNVSKLDVLAAAVAVGLEIPATLVTNVRDEIEAFRRAHGRIVSKSVGEVEMFPVFGRSYALYTSEATEEDIAALPATLFPTLVQAMVEKAFEIRAFYLDGELYASAIFSQADEQTAVDFRRYNRERPNRTVPFTVPGEVATRLRALMERLELKTGSIDLIRTPGGRYLFLEVNPGGQFGMVSHPCNYGVEKKVAEYLIRMDRDAAR
jgi:ATP-GRASP peptide maturase of grasp-with-spasm system